MPKACSVCHHHPDKIVEQTQQMQTKLSLQDVGLVVFLNLARRSIFFVQIIFRIDAGWQVPVLHDRKAKLFFQNARDRSGGPYFSKQNGGFTRQIPTVADPVVTRALGLGLASAVL